MVIVRVAEKIYIKITNYTVRKEEFTMNLKITPASKLEMVIMRTTEKL